MKRMMFFVPWLLAAALQAGEAKLTIKADQPGAKISPLLYGIFFEEINRAGDGGIYAEMIQNRSFEDAAVPVGWSVVGGEGRMTLDHSRPLNGNNPTSLRLDGRIRVANRGFKGAPYSYGDPAKWLPSFEQGVAEMPCGIAVQQGKQYQLSLYARGHGPVTVSIEGQGGTVLASQEVAGIGDAWKNSQAVLSPTATDTDARLVIATSQPGPVWLDMVSLMPKGQLFRADLLKLLADMKPAFVRFPGGCWVEGDELRFAHRWKKTIGDVAQRPGLWNRWGYYCNDGLGFHEYLLLCEALHAEPLFVINCGMSHEEQHGKPGPTGEKLQEYVQDALDAVEYCNGPTDSKWGSVRTNAGHPAPFNLKHMEIGNENGGPTYVKHYALFHDALKKRYPELHLIVDYRPTGDRPAEIVDEHYYNSPEFFLHNAGKYDKYDRAAHKVYVGEYAVTRGAGRGNLKAAIGEAAFMTGLERNGDIVVMASYAPLFEHVGWKRWNPNAILFDAGRSYGTPSWLVQTLFGANRGDVVLPTTVAAPTIEATEGHGGMIGVGAWHTQVEYKDIQVAQGDKVLFQGKKGWRFVGDDWKWDGDVLCQTGKGKDLRAYAGRKEWHDYTLTLKARKLGGSEGFLVMFAAPNDKVKSWWNLGGWGNKHHGLELPGVDAERVPGTIETGRWYDIKVELKGPVIRCYLDGKLIHEVTGKGMESMYAVASRVDATGEIVLKVVNAAGSSMETQIDLQSVKVKPTATAAVLTSDSPDDENSFEAPARVAPKCAELHNIGSQFRYTFPANSVTVMRLKTGEGPGSK